MERAAKKDAVVALNEVFKTTSVAVVAHYSGLTVAQMQKLRMQMRQAGASVKVSKNRLAKIALEGTDVAGIGPLLKGPTVIATSNDPVEPGLYRLVLDPPPAVSEIAATGADFTRSRLEVSEIREGDPNSGIWRHRAASAWRRGDWDCAVEAEAELTSTEARFHLTERLVARLDGEVIFERESRAVIDRDLI